MWFEGERNIVFDDDTTVGQSSYTQGTGCERCDLSGFESANSFMVSLLVRLETSQATVWRELDQLDVMS